MWYIKITKKPNLNGYEMISGMTVQGVDNASKICAKINWNGGKADICSLAEAKANGWTE